MHSHKRRPMLGGPLLPFAIASAMAVAGATAAHAASTDPSPNPLELANAQLSKQAAADGMVLLANQNHSLPLQKKTNVALFGVGAYATVKGGTGSGNVNQRYAINVRTGLENAGFTITTSPDYWDAMKSAFDTKYPPGSGGGFGGSVDYSSVEQALTATSVQPTADTDTAIYVLARNSGEGADRKAAQGDYLLTDTEQNDIALLGQTYKNVVVVLNSGGIVDTSFFDTINTSSTDPAGGTALDSLFLMSQAGEEGGNALAEVLDGDVTPSGHLTDSWASKYSYYPASATFGANDGNTVTEDYSEGVYVGYRYFDSFYKTIDAADPASVVNYPFGYGLSYTTFGIKTQSVKADMSHVTVKARVTNTGSTYAGKDVVQVYFSAPKGGEDKPYQELAGWAKTDVLAPGQSQDVTVTFATSDLASYYDSSASWVLDPGAYRIRVGDSSRNTHIAANVVVPSRVTTEQDSNQLDDQSPATLLHSDPANFYSYPTEAQEAKAAITVPLSTRGFKTVNAASRYSQNVAVDSTSPYYAIDGGLISSTTAYVDPAQTNWEGTGAPYAAKTGETVKPVKTNPNATLYDVAKGTTSMQQFVAGLSVTQLANIVEGASVFGTTSHAIGAAGYTTALYEKLGIPGMTLSDGPAGLRLTQQVTTVDPPLYQYTTAWPIGTLLSQTWNADLIQQVGEATGKEMAEFGVSLWLAPGMNIHRDPLNGRNFEYYSEDPLLSGLTAASVTKGVQSIPGEGVTTKHFDGNEQEANRGSVNDLMDERGAREIELKGFEYAVKSAQPMAVMSSYNKIGGSWSAQNYDLLTDLLRGEWGYQGVVMSDWGGSHDPVYSLYSGNDLIEPGNNPQSVINSIVKVPPTIDVNGLPVYNETVSPTRTSYAWQFNGITPSATGAQTFSTTVDSSTDLSKVPASGTTTVDAINNQTFTPNPAFTSVNDAYTQTQALLAGTALSAAQKAGISVTDVQYAADGTTVTSYTVVVKGDYAAAQNMRLGDLQRSATRVLNTAMRSPQFAELATEQGVSGITVSPYEKQFTNLTQFVGSTKGKVLGHAGR